MGLKRIQENLRKKRLKKTVEAQQIEPENFQDGPKVYAEMETGIGSSKDSKSIKIKFRLFDAGDNVLKGADIRLYKGNQIVEEVMRSTTIIQLNLEEGNYYTLEVSLNGFLTKRVVINTEILDGDVKKDEYRFEVELERSSDYEQYVDPEDVYDYPRAIIEFDTNTQLFKANEQYYLSTKKAFEKLYRTNREIKF